MHNYILVVFLFVSSFLFAQEKRGAAIPWTTYEAEKMHTNGTIKGPEYLPYEVETESSGEQCVSLTAKGKYVEFTSGTKANSIIIRFSLPDNKDGRGTHTTLALYKNNKLLQRAKISSLYTMLYGSYPFTNNPAAGKPRNFYDEIRILKINITKGDVIRIQRDDSGDDNANYCMIDFADLEMVKPPLQQPSNSLSIKDKQFAGNDTVTDYTNALRKCISMASEQKKIVWIPAGKFMISGDITLPSNITLKGAGMWYSTLLGNDKLYSDASKRVRLKGAGSNIHLSDFAIVGKLNYRNDNEPNDGIVGSYGTHSTIKNLWIEHTKVGMWIENSDHLQIEGCRMRNTIADGINFCVGMRESTIENCTARGTGDDCFAFWPTTYTKQEYKPGENRIIHCTAQLPFLANGAAIYGGESNKIESCSFIDITPGSAILLSTTFPTEDSAKNINNNFSGTTLIENCDIKTSGGFDHEWGWRAAVQICLDKRSISGIRIYNITIENSLSDGLSVIAKNVANKVGELSNTILQNVKIGKYGIGVKDRHGLWIDKDVQGSITISHSTISGMENASSRFIIHQ